LGNNLSQTNLEAWHRENVTQVSRDDETIKNCDYAIRYLPSQEKFEDATTQSQNHLLQMELNSGRSM